MSIELRVRVEGECLCGIPYHPADQGYPRNCRHDLVCDWGTFSDPPFITVNPIDGSVRVDDVSGLILVSKQFVAMHTAQPRDGKEVTAFTTADGRRFMRMGADNGTWTWELFDAHWWDGKDCTVYVGRWPD